MLYDQIDWILVADGAIPKVEGPEGTVYPSEYGFINQDGDDNREHIALRVAQVYAAFVQARGVEPTRIVGSYRGDDPLTSRFYSFTAL